MYRLIFKEAFDIEEYRAFPCIQCGECCRHVDTVPQIKNLDRGDGVCKNLLPNNLCRIYANRPDVCNGKFVYEHFYQDMTVADFHEMIWNLCLKIRKREFEKLH